MKGRRVADGSGLWIVQGCFSSPLFDGWKPRTAGVLARSGWYLRRAAGGDARSSDERGGVSELADTVALPWRLRTGTSALRTIPKGLRPPAQGCEARATLGTRSNKITTSIGSRPISLALAQHSLACSPSSWQ